MTTIFSKGHQSLDHEILLIVHYDLIYPIQQDILQNQPKILVLNYRSSGFNYCISLDI
jgi:hypothetical protein